MIAYILKATLFSAILFLIYALFMEKEKMHRFKRFYLLVSLILPFIVPLITIPGLSFVPKLPIAINLSVNSTGSSDISDNQINSYNITGSDRTINDIQNTIPQLASAPGNKGIWFILLVISCILVTLVMIIRFIRNIISIYLTIKSNKSVTYHEGTLVLTKESRIPHSFLNYIFVNQKDYESGLIEKEILRHELTHVSQKHSLDILFVEIILIFAWINPLLFFYRKAIRLNHEFLADQSVIETYSDTQTYQYLLFEKTRHTNSLSLSSPFNYLLTKKRIIMMSRKASPGIAILKQFAIIPFIAIISLLFTSKGCSEDLTGAMDHQNANAEQNDESFWQLVVRTDGSGNVVQEIIGEFKGTMDDNFVSDVPIKVKVFVTKRKDGEMFTEFYEADGETPENLHKKNNPVLNFNTQSVVDLEISLRSGEIVEIQQMIGGSHIWDFYTKAVPPPPGAPEGLRFGEPRTGDLLKLIMEQDSRVSIKVDFRTTEEFNNKIYRFDIDPAGLKELFAKL